MESRGWGGTLEAHATSEEKRLSPLVQSTWVPETAAVCFGVHPRRQKLDTQPCLLAVLVLSYFIQTLHLGSVTADTTVPGARRRPQTAPRQPSASASRARLAAVQSHWTPQPTAWLPTKKCCVGPPGSYFLHKTKK